MAWNGHNIRQFSTTAMTSQSRSYYRDDWEDRADGMPFDMEKFDYHPPTAAMWDCSSWWYPRTEHQMTWNNKYVDKKNALIKNKPVIDCSKPFNSLSREDQANRYGTSWGIWGIPSSMFHFHQELEKSSYTDSFSTRDCFVFSWGFLNFFAPQFWIQKYLMQAGHEPASPRTAWAHRIPWIARFFRLQVASVLGLGGYFVSYEFMYTYVPILRIRDPSPEAWKKNWQSGQTTFIARILASSFLVLGFTIYQGSNRRNYLYSWWILFFNIQYELFRGNVLHSGLIWKQMHHMDEIRERDFGGLSPFSKKANDHDTAVPTHEKSYKHYRRMETAQAPGEDIGFLDIPWHVSTQKWKNDHFSWSKASQGWNDKPYRCANDVWDEPDPLTANVLAGAYDGQTSAKNYGYNNRLLTGAHYSMNMNIA